MKLRYVSRFEPFMYYQKGMHVMSGDVVDYPAKIAADLLKRFPDKFFEEEDPKGKVAHKKNEDAKAARVKAKEKAEAAEKPARERKKAAAAK